MQYRRLGSLAAACTTIVLACTASASAAERSAAPGGARTLAANCTHGYTVSDHRRYAKRVFQRVRISQRATHRLTKLRRCQTHGLKATRAARRTEHRLKRWRTLYHCTQAKVVNCIAAHHQEVEYACLEAPIVQVADAISASRPGEIGRASCRERVSDTV